MSYLDSLFSLKNKTAVIVGGTGELCGAMAQALAGAGAEVVLVGRSEPRAQDRLKKISDTGGSGYFIPCNVTDREDLNSLLGSALGRSGQIDILVNGAGTNSPTPFLDISEDEYASIMDTNAKAVLLTCQVFGKYFLDYKIPASIINVGSMSGLIPLSRVFTYSMTKAAVHNLSKNLAREWAPHKIRVNTIVPGFFPAEQNRKVLTDDRVADIMKHTPSNRFGEAGELAGATLLLASNNASSFITGAEFVVDGGYAAMTI
jgi:NAD(P)-dependent dehydrogenase (short-subunit alcohol dehydrogenase family)